MKSEIVVSDFNCTTKSYSKKARQFANMFVSVLGVLGIVSLVMLVLLPQASEWLECLIWWFIN